MKIAISWNELPKYAAYAISEIIKKNPEVEIISIKSKLPIHNLEKIIKKKIHWVENKNLNWKDLNLDIPDIYFQAGWYKKSFSSLGYKVKNNGGKVVLLSDNSYKNNFRQLIGSVIYKLRYRNYFDSVWVPGKLGEKLIHYYGVSKKKIFQGLYCSNQKIFKQGITISKRPKTILFAGQLIKEKGFEELLRAFKNFLIKDPNWKLIIAGNGPLKKLIPKHDKIEYYSFRKPEEISKLMQQSRFLVLPSYSDHWPVVINEATLCGCGLIVSNVIGNIPELSNNKNSIICKIASEKSLTAAIEKASMLSDAKLDKMFKESLKLSSRFTISNWVKKYQDIINSLKNYKI
jgi:glycosyltransferase involved in cell wall biosynthesis